QTTSDRKHALEWLPEGPAKVASAAAVAVRPRYRTRSVVACLAVTAPLVLVAVALTFYVRSASASTRPIRFVISPPDGTQMGLPIVSPDGRFVAFSAFSTSETPGS